MLLTKALYNEHHYEFEKHLKHTSLMVPDRAVLFRYIHNLKEVAEVYQPKQPVETFTQPTALPEPVLEILEDIIPPPVETEKPVKPEETISIPEAEVVEDILEEIIEKPVADEVVEESIPETEPVINIVGEPLLPEPVVEETTETTPEPIAEVKQLITETEAIGSETTEIKVDASEIHSFSEWLKLQQGHKLVVESKPEPEPVSEPEVIDHTQETSVPEPEIVAEKEEIAPEPEPKETKIPQPEETPQEKPASKSNIGEFESILDKFIRENPKISRPKAEFYNPVNMAKQSVEADDELVTETLANVYYKQGHYKKAIRAYEKLCLIYPHKMTYFASLIQKIKTENKE